MSKTARSIVPRKTLQRLAQRRDLPGLIFLAVHMLAMVATGSLVAWSLGSAWLWPAMFIHGVLIVHLFAPFHEASHYTAFKSRWLNNATAWFTGLAVNLPPTHFRLEHRAHHAFTQDPAKDPELIPQTRSKRGIVWYATCIPYFQAAISSLIRHPFGLLNETEKTFIPESQTRKVVRDARIMWAVYLAIALISVALQSYAALIYWLIPRVIAEPVMRIIRMAEHGAMPYVPDMLKNTRTVKSLLPIRLLGWNMAYHAEHHNLPAVPFFALPQLHESLKNDINEVREGYIETQIHVIKEAA